MTVSTPDTAWTTRSSSPLDRRDGVGEYGARDNVDARDRCRRGSLGGRIGRAIRATVLRRRMMTTTTLMQKRESTHAISWRLRYANFESGISGGRHQR